jgi:hypothetical protein
MFSLSHKLLGGEIKMAISQYIQKARDKLYFKTAELFGVDTPLNDSIGDIVSKLNFKKGATLLGTGIGTVTMPIAYHLINPPAVYSEDTRNQDIPDGQKVDIYRGIGGSQWIVISNIPMIEYLRAKGIVRFTNELPETDRSAVQKSKVTIACEYDSDIEYLTLENLEFTQPKEIKVTLQEIPLGKPIYRSSNTQEQCFKSLEQICEGAAKKVLDND